MFVFTKRERERERLSVSYIYLIFLFIYVLAAVIPAAGEGSATFNSADGAQRTATFGFGKEREDTSALTPSIIAGTTSGITPTSDYRYFYVYAKAGETINLGTSFYEANPDIAVIFPDGTRRTYDIPNRVSGTPGVIADYLQERNGPSTACKITNCSNYYTPIKIDITQEGIYKVAFYSNSWTYAANNRTCTKVTDAFCSFFGQIDAWDITVTNRSNNAIPGRVFLYTFYNFHEDTSALSEMPGFSYYVLTSDGIIYKFQYSSMSGGTYVLVSNKRGLVDSTTNTSLHHTISDSDDTTKYAIRNTGKDEYYRMFLNRPDSDLLEYLNLSVPKTVTINNFQFTGNSGNVSQISNGGTFSFESSSGDGSYQIDITFSDGTSVSLANSLSQGINTITWDGKNSAGDIVGTQNSAITGNAILNLLYGETHNVLYDIERNPGGIKIDILNGPSAGDGIVYYDNSKKVINGNSFSSYLDNKDYSIQGINNNVLAFNHGGDHLLIDFWTYVKDNNSHSINIVIVDEITTSVIVNKRWEDESDRDGVRPSNISVKLLQNDVEYDTATITGSAGNTWTYTFRNLPRYNTDGELFEYSVEEVNND